MSKVESYMSQEQICYTLARINHRAACEAYNAEYAELVFGKTGGAARNGRKALLYSPNRIAVVETAAALTAAAVELALWWQEVTARHYGTAGELVNPEDYAKLDSIARQDVSAI